MPIAATTSPPPVETDERVYANTVGDLLDVIRASPNPVRTLAVVGHNPSMQGLAVHLVGDGSTAAADELRDGYPAGAVAVFAVEGEWGDIAPSMTSLSVFDAPRAGPN